LNFMIVGHTHDDTDALFGRWSMDLKKENFPTIPHLIEEVHDFKGFIANSFVDGDDILVGYTKPHQIKFYRDSTGCLVMKYKLLCTDVNLLGEGGRGIKLWKEDAEGQSLWLRGSPLLVLLKPMKGLEDIVKAVLGFVKYWDNLCNADVTGEYRRCYEHLVKYWCGVKVVLMQPLPTFDVLKDSFWPTSRIEASQVDQLDDDDEDREEFGEDETYVGH